MSYVNPAIRPNLIQARSPEKHILQMNINWTPWLT